MGLGSFKCRGIVPGTDQLTLFHPWGTDYAHYYYWNPPISKPSDGPEVYEYSFVIKEFTLLRCALCSQSLNFEFDFKILSICKNYKFQQRRTDAHFAVRLSLWGCYSSN